MKEELHKILSEAILHSTSLLVFANKQDLPGAMSVKEITEFLDMRKQVERRWFVQACSAVDGGGLYEGMDWLAKVLTK